MLKKYRTVYQYAEAEHIIERSRFIGYVQPISSEEEAIAFIEKIKLKHKGATHNVPVYILGENNEVQRYSDDGEPAGTAGVPVLDMLKKEEIKNVAIVVTRYFGGIKLGTGGLVRAYTSTAKLALQEAKIIEKVLYDLIKIRIDYTLLGKVQNEILNAGHVIKETVFDDAVNMYICTDVEIRENIINLITNLTSAKSEITVEDTLYLNLYNGQLMLE